MSGLHVHRVTTDDGALLAAYVREPSGPAGRTVVLGHGWILDHRSWLPVLRTLDPSLRVVLWDQRGHGASTLAGGSRKVGQESIRRLGADLQEVLKQLAPQDEQVVLGGHSMGGMTILAYAGLAPQEFTERVCGVALVSTAAGGLRGRGRRGEHQLMTAMRHLPVRIGRGMTEKAHRAAAFGPRANPADVHDATVIVRGTRVNVFAGYYDALMQHDEVAALASMQKVPAQVLVGARDRLTPPKLAQRIAAGLPQAELQTLDGLGHMLQWEAPDRVAKAIEDLAR